jgi:hypothetical protein
VARVLFFVVGVWAIFAGVSFGFAGIMGMHGSSVDAVLLGLALVIIGAYLIHIRNRIGRGGIGANPDEPRGKRESRKGKIWAENT